MVCRKLHNKRSRIAREHFCLFEHDTGNDDCRHADKVRAGRDPCGAAENRARDHRDERNFRAARDEGGRHDRHTTVTFIFDGTGSHDARDTAAGTDQHRNEGLAGQTELTEDTVEYERDTSHITAGFQESKQQEQYQHLRNETKDRANTGYDTVKQQSGQPFRSARGLERVADQNRNAGYPGAVGGSIRRAVGFLVIRIQILRGCRLVVSLCHTVNGFGGQRFFIFYFVGNAGVCRNQRIQFFQRGFRSGFRVVLVFDVQCVCNRFTAVRVRKSADDQIRVTVLLRCFFILRSTPPEEMIAVSEQSVVCPVCCRCTDGYHGNVVNQEHDQRENRQTQPAVCNHFIDLVRCRELSSVLFLITGLDDGGNVDVTLVGDDRFRVIVHFLFGCFDVLFDMRQNLRIDRQLIKHLIVSLKDLNRVPSLLFLRHVMYRSLFDVRQRVFNNAREGMHRNRLAVLCRVNRRFRRFHHACVLQGGDFNNLASKLSGKLFGIDLVSVFLYDIHHIDGNNHRNTEFRQLSRQIQISLQIRTVDDVEDRIRSLTDQVVSRHHFLQRVGRKRINSREVRDDDILVLL